MSKTDLAIQSQSLPEFALAWIFKQAVLDTVRHIALARGFEFLDNPCCR
jgi:hypothetical protein